ncbi:hypothetical protein DL770_005103 [Monosporascus sp. CRB-9-2]|nr:hypothetical protein DL770_005103 [Monosporascus sp. CRB-9-2]
MAAITSQNNTTDWEMEDYRHNMVAQHGTMVTAAADDSGSEENPTNRNQRPGEMRAPSESRRYGLCPVTERGSWMY